ncbi:MAG: metal-dependent transcriptional regulator [Peptococcaceae bacterium]|nr:metal-dependent transcriptional regulator [Peptococcaceae bacterium]
MTGYSQSIEDYLEAIHVIGLTQKVIRVKDVAGFLDVKMPSVVAALKSLAEKGLVEQEKYGHIELTPKGEAVAKEIYARHQMLSAFFREVLGLSGEVAEEDACRIEHHLSPATRDRLVKFVQFVRECPQDEAWFLKNFKRFVVTGERPECYGCCNANRPEREGK